MKIVYRGNHMIDWDEADCARFSTEWHVGESLRLLGHDVVRVQEDREDWVTTIKACADADVFLWTSTRDYAHRWRPDDADDAVATLNEMMPTVGVHLDLWWGLDREPDVAREPFFRLGWVFTADGDHDAEWERVGVNHRWMPPAVFGPECVPGSPRVDWASDVAFIGSWRSYAHQEWWPERRRMLAFLRERYRSAFQCWPRVGHGAVRGHYLNDLCASVKVLVGDSCMATTSVRYFSDRIFEHVGRGGFVVMQAIPALVDMLPEGMGVAYYPPGDLDALAATIDRFLADDDERERRRRDGQLFVRRWHTYEDRMAGVLDTLRAEGAFGP